MRKVDFFCQKSKIRINNWRSKLLKCILSKISFFLIKDDILFSIERLIFKLFCDLIPSSILLIYVLKKF